MAVISADSLPLKTAVLFFVFNRLDTTTQVFEAIRACIREGLLEINDIQNFMKIACEG
jgi:hypothetical protein